MKRHGHLFEQVVTFDNLVAAARRAVRGKTHRPVVGDFLVDLEPEVLRLERELLDGSYLPRPYRTFWMYEPKPRRICAAHIRDRVVHHPVCAVLDPILEAGAIHDSYACRRDRGSHRALARAQFFSRRHSHFLKLDVRHFFDSVDHRALEGLPRRAFFASRPLVG